MVGELLIDVTRLLARSLEGKLPTGVDRVTLEYVRHFQACSHAVVRYGWRWVILNQRDTQRLFDALLSQHRHLASVVRWYVGRSYLLNWRRFPGAWLLNVTHSGLENSGYAEKVSQLGLRAVFFLHDLIPIEYPEYGRSGESGRHQARLHTMYTSGRGIMLNSEATQQSLDAFARRRSIALPPCKIAPLAPAGLPRSESDPPLSDPYFVVLGTIEPRKNHLLLLHVWRQLVEEMGSEAPTLVVIGQRGWECEQVIDLLERNELLKEHVIEKQHCSDAELSNWLGHARALLFPSFAEGYGMPLVEALAMGVPVIASDLAVFREIAGVIPEYLDTLDGPGWKRMIKDYAKTGSAMRTAQCARMVGYDVPTWEQHFARVEEFLETIGEYGR